MQSNAIQDILDLDFHIEIKMTPVFSKTVMYGSSNDTRRALCYFCLAA